MMKDYYVILGLPREASKDSIKKAYRHIAKRLHPDKCENGRNRQAFLDAKDAYETLADDRKRKAYDAALQQEEAPQSPGNRNEARFAAGPAEKWRRRPSSPVQDIPFTERAFYRNRTDCPVCLINVLLTPAEARHGRDVDALIQVNVPCPRCTGGFLLDRFFCPLCMGSGTIEQERPVTISIPPGTAHGTTFQSTLHLSGNHRVMVAGIIYVKE
ncbi:MAG: DnaJ domain-containing protein [Thermodesulfobacteriota bacterium]|nr:DnaJ domain-containing protein [Thermodesulfobacteriota bacterium]